MNKYAVAIKKYFGSCTIFEVEAENKEDAKKKVIELAERDDNYNLNTICVKKVQKFKR